jgi:hypothetical protein
MAFFVDLEVSCLWRILYVTQIWYVLVMTPVIANCPLEYASWVEFPFQGLRTKSSVPVCRFKISWNEQFSAAVPRYTYVPDVLVSNLCIHANAPIVGLL